MRRGERGDDGGAARAAARGPRSPPGTPAPARARPRPNLNPNPNPGAHAAAVAQARFLAQSAGRLRPAAAFAHANGPRGPPSAVLSDSAVWIRCRGPLSHEGCVEERWEAAGRGKAWLALDLGGGSLVQGLLIDWAARGAGRLAVQISDNGTVWRTVWARPAAAPRAGGAAAGGGRGGSMHDVETIDLRKAAPQGEGGGAGANKLVRPRGVAARFVRCARASPRPRPRARAVTGGGRTRRQACDARAACSERGGSGHGRGGRMAPRCGRGGAARVGVAGRGAGRARGRAREGARGAGGLAAVAGGQPPPPPLSY